MAGIDPSGWNADHPEWTFAGFNATYSHTPGDNSSRLFSEKIPLGTERTISFYATVAGGHGIVYLRGYTADNLPLNTISRGGTGLLAVSYTFGPQFTHYQLGIGAFPERGDAGTGDVIDMDQVIGFSSIGSNVAIASAASIPGQVVTDADGTVIERGPSVAKARPSIPTSQHDFVRGSKIDKNWYQFLQALNDAIPSAAEIETKAAAAVASLAEPEFKVHQTGTTEVTGSQAEGYQIGMRPLADSGTGDALVKVTRDAFGRVEGTEAATTDDLAEGSNLYHTDARRSEVLVADGVSAPPVMLTNEAEDDFTHQG